MCRNERFAVPPEITRQDQPICLAVFRQSGCSGQNASRQTSEPIDCLTLGYLVCQQLLAGLRPRQERKAAQAL